MNSPLPYVFVDVSVDAPTGFLTSHSLWDFRHYIKFEGAAT